MTHRIEALIAYLGVRSVSLFLCFSLDTCMVGPRIMTTITLEIRRVQWTGKSIVMYFALLHPCNILKDSFDSKTTYNKLKQSCPELMLSGEIFPYCQ